MINLTVVIQKEAANYSWWFPYKSMFFVVALVKQH